MNESKMDRIRHFIKTWKGHGHEIADKVTYWNTLLSILGVPQQKLDDNNYISYEKRVNVDKMIITLEAGLMPTFHQLEC